MNEQSTGVLGVLGWVAFGAVLLFALAWASVARRRRDADSRAAQPGSGDEDRTLYVTTVCERASEFERAALAYYVGVECSEQKAPAGVRAALVGKYGETDGPPVLTLTDLYRDDLTQRSAVESAIAGWLEVEGLVFDADAPLNAALGDPLETRARAAAARIVAVEIAGQAA